MNEYSISVKSAAKVNLTLDVVGLRADGYHELRSIIHTVGIWDTLTFRFTSSGGLTLKCANSELAGDDNLCLKAARAWQNATHRVLDCGISLEKTIPTGAGLGGGSGNAAATLLALNSHFDNALRDDELHAIATKLGADVPLFLRGGCSLIEGIGEKITALRALEGWLVVVQPTQKLSTPQVFRAFDALKIESANASTKMRTFIENGADLTQIAPLLSNDLTRAAENCGVDLRDGLENLRKNSALGVAMTGSGSAFFGIFEDEIAAQNALQNIKKIGVWNFAQIAPLVSNGVRHTTK